MKKPVEWKDTKMSISVNYEYSLFVRNRCTFFYCYAKNVRKMINYAENFACPYNICVIYVYGTVKPETVLKHLSQKRGHILLLVAPQIAADDIKTIAEYGEWLKTLKKQGLLKITNEGKRKNEFSKIMVGVEYGDEPGEDWYRYYNQPNAPAFYNIYIKGIELIERNKKAKESIKKNQIGLLDTYANFEVPDTLRGDLFNHEIDLLQVVKNLYPYGVECDAKDETAVKLLKIKKLVQAAMNGEQSADVQRLGINLGNEEQQQLYLWDNLTAGAVKCVEFLKEFCHKSIEGKGCFHISELWKRFSRPPYGAYTCNWYEYLFAVALSDYNSSDFFYGDGLCSSKIHNLENIGSYKTGFVFRQNEKQEKFKKLFAKLFDIEDASDTTQGIITKAAMDWVAENVKWSPLDFVDHRFYEIFAENDKENIFKKANEKTRCYWYEFGYEEKYLPWIEENFDTLYKKIRKVDEDFKNQIAEKYGEKRAELYSKSHTVKGGAVGWLHSVELVMEGVERYMRNLVCSECGNYIGDIDNVKFGYTALEITEDGKLEDMEFSQKDIVGLNKKLIGRTREEYLCIPCLAEFCECSERELWKKIHEFKEQGCELFS